ncbi:hypothetical protein RB595_009869 [Gaeumannomyces hyphopodioides]
MWDEERYDEVVAMGGIGQSQGFEAVPMSGVEQWWEVEGAGAGPYFKGLLEETLADLVSEPQCQGGQDVVGILAGEMDDGNSNENGSNDNDSDGMHDWMPTFPLSAFLADKMEQQTTTTPSSSSSPAAAVAPTLPGTAAPDLTQASPSSPELTQASSSSPSGGGSPGTPGAPRPRGRRRFRCSELACPWAFDIRKDLRRHVDSVHGGTTTTCPDCGAVIKGDRKDNLRRHQMSQHGFSRPAARGPRNAAGFAAISS